MNETTDATTIFAPLWRRKWLILAVAILAAAGAYAYYRRQPHVYTATTQVYLGSGSEVQALLNTTQSKGSLSERDVTDQTTLINSSAVGEAVRLKLKQEHRRARGPVAAKSIKGSEFITITSQAHSARGAALLANAYAQAYIARQSASYRRQVKAAIAITAQQLRKIERGEAVTRPAKPQGGSAGSSSAPASSAGGVLQAANISSKLSQLESDLAVRGVQQVSLATAKTALLISPKPRKNAIFGFLLGLVLAAIAAYTFSRFDRRLRSLADVEGVFRAPILAALPTTRQAVVRNGQPAPAAVLLEPLRRLHTSLQLGDVLDRDRGQTPRLILFISPDPGDGKSTLVANLALVQGDSGERVAVVDADLRQPVQAKLLDVDGPYGLEEVLAGTVPLYEAMQRVQSITEAGSEHAESDAGVATMVASQIKGGVSVLMSRGAVANPPALLASQAMATLLRSVAEDFDYALVDAPSPLAVSDAMPLLQVVDGVVIVVRLGHTRQVSAQRLVQLLSRVSSAPVLGTVASQVSAMDLASYGFSPPRQRRWRTMLSR